ncbi:hypothetical protein V2J09_010481 [Rumex salicifolius]
MVAAALTATMASWILPSSDRKRPKTTPKHHAKAFFWNPYNNKLNDAAADAADTKPTALGILSFDAAKTISRLISLYRSLSDAEVYRLHRHVVASRGVSYLNSDDDSFLLALACAELLEDLDRAADSVSRLGSRCTDANLSRFDLVYSDLKLGYVDVDKLYNGSGSNKEIERSIKKFERLMITTSNLYEELEALTQLEASERRLNEWKQTVASAAAAGAAAEAAHAASVEEFEARIAAQRKLVRQLKEGSLWAKSIDKTVGFAARVICVVFARMCAHFGPYVAVLPHVKGTSRTRSCKIERYSCHAALQEQMYVLDKLFDDPELLRESHSGPIVGSGLTGFGFTHNNKANLVRFMSRESNVFELDRTGGLEGGRTVIGYVGGSAFSRRPRNKVFQAALPSTVGGSGLALRYANIITLAEKYIKSDYVIGVQAKNQLYEMLPASLRARVRSKLNKWWRHVEVDEARRSGSGAALAVGWREAVEEMLMWLGPVARDTLTWHDERSLETQRFDGSRPTVLLMQTLHYSDLEKTEAAVAEVLVGLSCIYRYENRRLVNGDGEHVDGT